MAQYTRDGATLDIPDSALPIVKDWVEKGDKENSQLKIIIDEKEKALSDFKAKFQRLEDSLSEAQGKITALKEENKSLAEKHSQNLDTLINERRMIERQVESICGDTVNYDSTTRQLKQQAIASKYQSLKDSLETRSDEEINGMFAIAIQDLSTPQASKENVKDSYEATSNKDEWDLYYQELETEWHWVQK